MQISLLADYPHEAKTIAKWYYDEWLSDIPNISIERISKKISTSANQSQIPIMLLTHEHKELTGAVELKLSENVNYPEYEYWLGGLFVNPKFRGKGISHILINAIKEQAKKFGVKRLHLQCESNNVELYKKHHFLVMHNATHNGTPVVIMSWLVE